MSEKHGDTTLIVGAILTGSVIIALGLFFGLRERSTSASPGAAEPDARALANPVGTVPALPAPSPSAPTPGVASPALRAASAAGAAQKIFDQQRAAVSKRCAAQIAASGKRRTSYLLKLVFAEDGKELMRAISETAESNAAVAACLRAQGDLEFSIDPPGAVTSVELTVTLPD